MRPAVHTAASCAGVIAAVALALGFVAYTEPDTAADPRGDAAATPSATPPRTVTATATVVVKPKPRPTITVTRRVVQRASRSNVRVAPPASSGGRDWDAVARCESGGNWQANTGNGFYGGLQFMAATWRQAGGTKYAAMPHHATRAQQIAVADRWLDRTSWQTQWPVCGRYL